MAVTQDFKLLITIKDPYGSDNRSSMENSSPPWKVFY